MMKPVVFCFVMTLLSLNCNITHKQVKPHDFKIFIENKPNMDTIYVGVMKNYTISIIDDVNDNVQLELITPVNGCTLNASKFQLSWLPAIDDTGWINLKIAAKDDAANTDTLNAEFFVVLGNNFGPIAIGNNWQYSYEFMEACLNIYGGIKKISTIAIKILSTVRHKDSLQFSFERYESGVEINTGGLGDIDSSDTSDYSTSDTFMMLKFNKKFYYYGDTSWVENTLSTFPYFYVVSPSDNLTYDSFNSNSVLKYTYNSNFDVNKVQYINNIGMVAAQLYGAMMICGQTKQLYQLISCQIY